MDFTSSVMVVSAVVIFSIVISSLVWMSDHKTLANRLFLGIIAIANFWTIFSILSFSSRLSPDAAHLTSNLAAGLSFALVLVCYLFSEAIVRKKLSNFTRLLLVPTGIVLTILFSTKYNCGDLTASQNCQGGTLYTFMITCIGILFILIAINCIKGVTSKSRAVSKQMISLAGGLVGGILYGVILGYILPVFNITIFNEYYSLATVIFICFAFYAIVRHKLFDIRLVIARSIGYLISVAVLAAIYGLIVVGGANLLFELKLSVGVQVFISAAAAVAALLFGGLKQYFNQLTDRLFFRDSYDTGILLNTLNKLFVSTTDLYQLLDSSSSILSKNFKPEFCLFGIREQNGSPQRIIGDSNHHFSSKDIEFARHVTPDIVHKVIVTKEIKSKYPELYAVLERNNIAVLCRLINTTANGHEGYGYIVFGPKKNGKSYNIRDIQTLEIITNTLVIAVENSLHFEEIKLLNSGLQERIDAATKKLRNNNDKLRALDNTKDDFISMASHQLRTPLTSVKGYLSMVIDGDAGEITETQKKLLNQAFVSSQRMVYTIADLLNVSRLKTGKFIIERSPVNLADVLQQEITPLIEAAQVKNVSLSYKAPDFCPPLMLDETKIRQVIMNFIDNAIYYTPSGGSITVDIKTSSKMLELRVTDTGMGVPKADQPHMFTKFYRAANAQKARPDGTGLGIFMAKKIIIAQGGALIFKSTEGKGSTFGFSFPLVRE